MTETPTYKALRKLEVATAWILLAAAVAVFAGRSLSGVAAGASAKTGSEQLAFTARLSSGSPVVARPGYGWPLKPFNGRHVVRSYLNDPRIAPTGAAFHFGIDIGVPRPVTVYAVEAGTVRVANPRALMIWSSRGGRHAFGYWHVVPCVRAGQHVERRQLLGHTMVGWNHLHFAELRHGVWLNPLRPGGIGPFSDRTMPTIVRLVAKGEYSDETGLLRGRVDVVADLFDTSPNVRPGPWPVTPALIRWRILKIDGALGRWHVVLDSRQLQDKSLFHGIYAPGTLQNHRRRPGHYRYYLLRDWNSRELADGRYVLQVSTGDIRGNATVANAPIVIGNHA